MANHVRLSTRVVAALLLGAGLLSASPGVQAWSEYGGDWETLYSPSLSGSNSGCALCHTTIDPNRNSGARNPYGAAMEAQLGTLPVERLRAIEGLNSDNDPGGATNLAEITANTQPGWTVGDAVPSGITGVLDPTSIFSAVLPVSRSAVVGSPVTVFGTIINAGTLQTATTCGVALAPTAPAGLSLLYQTTDPATNQVIGLPNTPVNIAPGFASQSFVVALTPSAPFAPVDMPLVFDCDNSPPAPTFVGVNTLLISASTTPVPDVVALAATLDGNGIVNIPGASGASAFAVASVNVEAGGAITVAADTGGATLPVNLTLCETNPGTGQCLQTPAASVATFIANRATPTFSIFVQGTGSAIPFDPAVNRVFVRFRDGGGIVRGATSVAVRTQQ